jgi:hypothetical protein
MALSAKDEKKVVYKVFAMLSGVVAVVLLALGYCAWSVGNTAVTMVNKDLTAEKIYFPPSGSPMFSAEAFPDAQKYAGMQVTDGELAKAYAEDFLDVQAELLSGGQTLSEVSAALAADPTNPALQQLQPTLFQIETSKGGLLADAYGTWAQGKMMMNAGVAMLVVGGLLALLAVLKAVRYKQL